MNWLRYSRSIRSTQASVVTPISPSRDGMDALVGALRDIGLTTISRSRDEPHPVVDPFDSLFVVDDQRLYALCGGPARELETFSATRAQARTTVQKQQVAGEFLLWVVGTRQQR